MWRLQLFCKVGFVRLVLCALQMCCNVRWVVREFALNVLSLEGERNFVLGWFNPCLRHSCIKFNSFSMQTDTKMMAHFAVNSSYAAPNGRCMPSPFHSSAPGIAVTFNISSFVFPAFISASTNLNTLPR